MADLIYFPDRLEELGTHLMAELEAYGVPAPVSTKAPDDPDRPGPRGAGYVRIGVSAYPAGKVTEDVQLIADVYDDDPAAAAHRAAVVRAVLAAAPEALDSVYAARITTGPYETPDPRTDMTRVTVMAFIRMRATTLSKPTHEGAQ